MGIGASIGERYMGGKRLPRFYQEEIVPGVKDIFSALRVPEGLGFAIFRVFVAIDKEEVGLAQQEDCYAALNGHQSKFSERIFFCHIVEPGGTIRTGFTFREFFIAAWSFCSLGIEGVARYIFEIFDADRMDVLERRHVATMFKMLYNVDEIEDEYVNVYTFNGRQEITKSTFMENSRRNPSLIRPALQYQTYLRRRLGGKRSWEVLCAYRYSKFLMYDVQSDTLAESVDSILYSSEELFRSRQTQSAENLLRASSTRILADINSINRELRAREQQLEQERKTATVQDKARPMKRAWALYQAKKEAFCNEEYLTDDVWRRREERLELYSLLDKAVEASNEYYIWKDDRDQKLAEGTGQDHEARYQDFIQTPEGETLRTLLLLLRTFESVESQMLEKLSKMRRKPMEKSEKQALVETAVLDLRKVYSMVCMENDLNGSVSRADRERQQKLLQGRNLGEELKAARKLASKQDNNRVESLVHEELCSSLRDKTIETCKRSIAASQEDRKSEYKKKEFDMAMNLGSRITRWEYVLEKKSNKYFYMNVDTMELRHPKTAICEHCDAILIQHEKHCIECNSARSPKNALLYRPLGYKDITAD